MTKEEAIEVYNEIINPKIREAFEVFAPELVKNKDEEIRKEIIDFIRWATGRGSIMQEQREKYNSWLAWLEKQESEPNWCHHKVDLSNCSEEYRKAYYDGWNNCNQQHSQCKSEGNDVVKCLVPKFKVGDWVVWDNKISCHIDNIYQGKESLMYTITDTNNMIRSYSVKSFDNNARLWTIQDAKDGDVLAEDSCIFIIQKYGDNTTEAKTYYTLYDDGDFDDGTILYFDIDSTKPATKEQRDMLFQKMHEAGYTFDFEKKELKEIHVIDEGKSEMDYCFTKMMNGEKVTPAWSEEDEKMKDLIISVLEVNHSKGIFKVGLRAIRTEEIVSWLKSLKQRIEGE